jgi:AcrR family transcriptional regulator
MAGRRPGPSSSRADILVAARELFAEKGYDGASIRAIARNAGVDPAMVHHFFDSKDGLFVTAMEFPLDPSAFLPGMLEGPRSEIGERFVRMFLGLWQQPATRVRLTALMRSAASSEQGAAMLREFMTSAVVSRVAATLEIPPLRVNLAAGQMIGVALLKYVVVAEPVASASEDELVELLAPTIQRYLGR